MLEKIKEFQSLALEKIQNAKTEEDLKNIEQEFFGRKNGYITLLLRDVPSLPKEERPLIGKEANIAKKFVEEAMAEKVFFFQKEAFSQIAKNEWIDVTAPAKNILQKGKRHPIHAFIDECEDVFGRLGFEMADGYEIEDEDHNFNKLNVSPDHPAREMQDTFWMRGKLEGYVLRTQTSDVQIRFMERQSPPIRIIAPGKVFRKDSDATHSPMFHQIECLMVDKNVSLAHLRFILLSALRELISPEVKLRFRLSFFPFTEPSLEVDAFLKTEKGERWLEIGGAGMVHPNVLKNVGLDPVEWNGFAFGFGIERMIMIKHGIHDLRMFFENDLRFLEQF